MLKTAEKNEQGVYRKFHNQIISDVVLDYCHEAQKVLQHQKILGVFFEYIMELPELMEKLIYFEQVGMKVPACSSCFFRMKVHYD